MRPIRGFCLTCLVLVWLATAAWAHEFWLEPAPFRPATGSQVRIGIRVGEGFQGEPWSGTPDRIVRLDDYHHNQVDDVRAAVTQEHPQEIRLSLTGTGQHLLAFNNRNKLIKLEQGKFNEYLRQEGLDSVLSARARAGETEHEGRELYQRCVKTLLCVGSAVPGERTWAVNTGMQLELIPTTDPYAVSSPDELEFKVLYQNKPLAGALVQIWHRSSGQTSVLKLRSGPLGTVRFPLEPSGIWMVSTVHMVAAEPGQEADWQSYWSSFTFGY